MYCTYPSTLNLAVTHTELHPFTTQSTLYFLRLSTRRTTLAFVANVYSQIFQNGP